MPEYQVFRALRRRPVIEGHDLFIGPADAHVEHPEPHLICREWTWFGMIDQVETSLRREDGDGFHETMVAREVRGSFIPQSDHRIDSRRSWRWRISPRIPIACPNGRTRELGFTHYSGL